MSNQLAVLEQAQSTIVDLVIKFGPKLGVAGASIALAMQGVLGNLAAGLTIIFTRPFRVGEYVAIVGVEGEVPSIDLFSTRLSHPVHSVVVVPNRKIVENIRAAGVDYPATRDIRVIGAAKP